MTLLPSSGEKRSTNSRSATKTPLKISVQVFIYLWWLHVRQVIVHSVHSASFKNEHGAAETSLRRIQGVVPHSNHEVSLRYNNTTKKAQTAAATLEQNQWSSNSYYMPFFICSCWTMTVSFFWERILCTVHLCNLSSIFIQIFYVCCPLLWHVFLWVCGHPSVPLGINKVCPSIYLSKCFF